ncbi:MAG: zf-HC2 domain-containing protein [Candidatus Eisenbacteria bacterium]|nr:zf-HC2 domain-containing protein [Candidatus Eisenbacteria bacterium]
MRCSAARDLFSVAFDGELSVAEEREFNSHVSSCHGCSREFDLFSKSVRLVSSLSRPPVNPFFEARLKHAVGEREAVPLRERSSVLVLRPAIAFAAMAVLVSLLLFVPPGQVGLNGRLSISEFVPSTPELSEVGGVPEAPSDLTYESAASGSYDADRLSADGNTAWPAQDARLASSRVSSGTAVPVRGGVASAKDVILDVEFVLDRFCLEGTEVRRLETTSASGIEPELVSMTF